MFNYIAIILIYIANAIYAILYVAYIMIRAPFKLCFATSINNDKMNIQSSIDS